MMPRTPRATRTDTRCPYTTLFRSARARLTFIQHVGEEGLFPQDYDPQGLQAAIDGGNQILLDKVATDAFLLLATHLRDGRTPNAARKQWFMTDNDVDGTPLIPLLDYADRKSVVSGKSVSVRVDLGGRSIIKKKKTKK